MISMTDLLNDYHKRGESVSIYVAGYPQRKGITGVVTDVTTDLVEVISPWGETFHIRHRSIDVVVLTPSTGDYGIVHCDRGICVAPYGHEGECVA